MLIAPLFGMDSEWAIHVKRKKTYTHTKNDEKYYEVLRIQMDRCRRTTREKTLLGRFSLAPSTLNSQWITLREFAPQTAADKKITLKCAIEKARELNFAKLVTLAHIPAESFRKISAQPLTKTQRESFFREVKFFEKFGFHEAPFNSVFLEKNLT
ncbi:TPA: hypothetical protein DD799_02630 [Candidatus Dependentiae bacterium]|nr:hypothetical protein [Candidatus Dependentiae bacterium]